MFISSDKRHIALAVIAALGMAACGTTGKNAGKLPFGVMDTPRTGETLKGKVVLSGWALSEAGITEIAVYLDRSYVMSGQINGQRPDVAKAFPNVPNGQNSGWAIHLDTSTIAPGPHELVVRAIDTSGSVRDIGSAVIGIAR